MYFVGLSDYYFTKFIITIQNHANITKYCNSSSVNLYTTQYDLNKSSKNYAANVQICVAMQALHRRCIDCQARSNDHALS